MNARYYFAVMTLFTALIAGCGGSGGNEVIEATPTEISPSEAASQTAEYEKAMNN